jgi:V8-like Glu-specific endopeptidase
VVDSPSRNTVVTAAHCLSGDAVGLLFVPMYHDSVAPYGAWTVRAAYVDAQWLAHQHPQADVAFLRLAPQLRDGRLIDVQDVVGADRLVVDQPLTTQVVVVGYPAGTGGRPIICANMTTARVGYPAFDCNGYVDGTSGGPWLARYDPLRRTGDLYGIIGGLDQGGCLPYTSYSSHFSRATADAYHRATSGAVGDVLPVARNSGC